MYRNSVSVSESVSGVGGADDCIREDGSEDGSEDDMLGGMSVMRNQNIVISSCYG